MINDGSVHGEKFIGRKGTEVRKKAGKKGKQFTTLGLTSLSGIPVMCIVIFEGVVRNLYMES